MKFISSHYTTLCKYFSIGLAILITFGIIALAKLESSLDYNFYYACGILLLWTYISSVLIFFSLKTLSLTDQGITIQSSTSEKTIPYENVQAVHYFHPINTMGVTVEYFDKTKGEISKISYKVNSAYAQPFFKEDKMTSYLKELARQHNPNFQESSTIKNLLSLLVLASPFLTVAMYFMAMSQSFGVS